MKQIQVPYTTMIDRETSLDKISSLLDMENRRPIEEAPWGIQGNKPQIQFSIIHSNDCIALKYYVAEQYVNARYHMSNDPVYKDSCVEFFIALEDNGLYYNFEFNCVGACLMGYGVQAKTARQYQSPDVIDKIKRSVLLKTIKPGNTVNWEMTLLIPIEVFCHHKLESLKGLQCRANFYKCGDELPTPHFLAWNNIEAPEPNFHLPEFFGKLLFAEA